MKSWMVDLLVTFSTIAVAAGFGYLYYLDVHRQVSSGNGQPIGTITYEHNVTQRRYANRVVWQQVGDNALLYNQDSIRTAASSDAVIRLADGTRIALSPNSLITIDWGPKTKTINFLSGSITAIRTAAPAAPAGAGGRAPGAAAAGAQPAGLVIRSGRSRVIVNNATVNLAHAGNGSLAVDVASGQADLASGRSIKTLSAAQVAKVNTLTGAASISNLQLVPLAPSPGAIYVTAGRSAAIGFSWRSAASQKNYTLELAPNGSFGSGTRSFDVGAESTKAQLSPGLYYWRVAAGPASSPVEELSVLRSAPVSARSPSPGTVFHYLTQPPYIDFGWSAAQNAGSYELEVAADPQFSRMVERIPVATTSISLNSLSAGRYYWRVVPVYGYGTPDEREASPVRSFRVVRETALTAATLIAPAEGAHLSVLSVGSKGVLFNWAAQSSVAVWSLVLAHNSSLSEVVTRATTSNNYYLLRRLLEPGTYYWRVSGADSQGARTPPSIVRSFAVRRRAASIALTSPKEDWNYDGATFANVPVVWKSNLGGTYEVDLSTTSGFATYFKRMTTEFQHASFGRLPSGTYFWRVSLLTPGGSRLLTSATGTFTVLAPLLAPQVVSPARGAALALINPRNLRFRWNGDPRSQFYDFALYRTGANGTGRMIAHAKDLTSNEYTITDLGILRIGSYTWQVETNDPSGVLQSAQQSPPTQASFTIGVLRFIPSPQLLFPGRNAIVSGVAALDRGVSFRWVSPDPRGSAVVQIASDPFFTKAVRERYAGPGTTTVSLTQLLPGTYYWKVEAKTHDGVDAPPSAVNEFTVGALLPLAQPRHVVPAQGSAVDMWNATSLSFSWASVSHATSYRIALEEPNTGTTIFSERGLKTTTFRYTKLSKLNVGKFIWTIQAMQADAAGAVVRSSIPLAVKFAIVLGRTIKPAQINSPGRFYVH